MQHCPASLHTYTALPPSTSGADVQACGRGFPRSQLRCELFVRHFCGPTPASPSHHPAAPWQSLATDGQDGVSCAIDAGGVAWCWYGAGGRKDACDLCVPGAADPVSQPAVGGARWVQLSVGEETVCGVQSDGQGRCWGSNAGGAAGTGESTSSSNYHANPTALAGGGSWRQISMSGYGGCGITVGDSLLCWGSNNLGAFYKPGAEDAGPPGEPSSHPALVPVPVGQPGIRWRWVDLAMAIACAIDTNSQLWCWVSGWAAPWGLCACAHVGLHPDVHLLIHPAVPVQSTAAWAFLPLIHAGVTCARRACT